jgi:hypothetical protein
MIPLNCTVPVPVYRAIWKTSNTGTEFVCETRTDLERSNSPSDTGTGTQTTSTKIRENFLQWTTPFSATFKGIVSRKFAILSLVSLESLKYSTPFLLKPFLNLSPFSYDFRC